MTEDEFLERDFKKELEQIRKESTERERIKNLPIREARAHGCICLSLDISGRRLDCCIHGLTIKEYRDMERKLGDG